MKDKRTYSERKESNKASVSKRRKQNKLVLVEYKGGKCELCGYSKCIAALEFHHKDPKQKSFNLNGNTIGLKKQKQEADKCLLLCANCHREVHEMERSTTVVQSAVNGLVTGSNPVAPV